jgi:hypothetical protein
MRFKRKCNPLELDMIADLVDDDEKRAKEKEKREEGAWEEKEGMF